MKRFLVEVPAERVEGSQIFSIEAEDQEEAFRLIRAGKGEWVEDSLEVTASDFHNLHIAEETDI